MEHRLQFLITIRSDAPLKGEDVRLNLLEHIGYEIEHQVWAPESKVIAVDVEAVSFDAPPAPNQVPGDPGNAEGE